MLVMWTLSAKTYFGRLINVVSKKRPRPRRLGSSQTQALADKANEDDKEGSSATTVVMFEPARHDEADIMMA